MRNPKVKNKYKLTFADVKKLEILDRSKVTSDLFWRNNVVQGWCMSGTTIKNKKDSRYGTYSDFWICIYDEDSKNKRKFKVTCSAYGGMCKYEFKQFFNFQEIEDEDDLLVQELLLEKINMLIDLGILGLKK